MLRWLLVFEDPDAEVLWLGRGMPRPWLSDGKLVSVASAPTRWGRVGFAIQPALSGGRIDARVSLPATRHRSADQAPPARARRCAHPIRDAERTQLDASSMRRAKSIACRRQRAAMLSIVARY